MTAAHGEFDDRLRDAKLAALAEFAAGAGHEINNPVATIVGRAQQLLRTETNADRRRALAVIAAQGLRIRDMIGDLMLFARPPEPQPVWCDLVSIVREVVEPFRDRLDLLPATIVVEADEPVSACVDPRQIAVAIAALIENAINALNPSGRITVRITGSQGVPTITITDNGAGFSDLDREHAFDPFYSGRQAGRGLGFGLPKAWRIITLAEGSIAIDSRPGETSVRIALPRPEQQLESDQHATAPPGKPPGRDRCSG